MAFLLSRSTSVSLKIAVPMTLAVIRHPHSLDGFVQPRAINRLFAFDFDVAADPIQQLFEIVSSFPDGHRFARFIGTTFAADGVLGGGSTMDNNKRAHRSKASRFCSAWLDLS